MTVAMQAPGGSARTQFLALGLVALAAALVGGGLISAGWWQPRRALAAAAAVEDSFAVCTAPVGDGMEGLFMLDFETGDVSGGVLNQNTAKFTVGYRYNVLKDLGFKAGKVKNPKFLLVPGLVNFMGPQSNKLGQSVLYVTDVATGVTAAYGVPWTAAAATAAGGPVLPLVLLDVVKPRGGGDKAP
jgi:hypothetical protein